ncbi:hypothetical protein ACFCX4_08935 [Kitasatospora sp. NPDC056327]|uniref:hypothetical protein n=1 Tax=Kitasatospora sp. NPDC056327 TaxID=3345785 RepID=UPI0035E1B9E5
MLRDAVEGHKDDGGNGAAVVLRLTVEGDLVEAEHDVAEFLVVFLLAGRQGDGGVVEALALADDAQFGLQGAFHGRGTAAAVAFVAGVVDQ